MKLKEFEKPKYRKPPIITFYPENGSFFINAAAKDLLNAFENNVIKFFQNEDNPEEWFFRIYENKEPGGSVIRNFAIGGIAFNNKKLLKDLVDTMRIPKDIRRFYLSDPEIINNEKYFKLSVLKK